MQECQTIKKIWKWNAMIYAEDTQAYFSFEPTKRATEIKKDRRMHPRYKVYKTSTEISWLQLSWKGSIALWWSFFATFYICEYVHDFQLVELGVWWTKCPFRFRKLGVSPNLFLSCGFLLLLLFLLSHNLFLLPHDWSDFDLTWSEWPVGEWLQNYQQIALKGHLGVTGVKKVIFTKNVSTHLNYVAGSRDSRILTSFVLSTKVINERSIKGHLGLQGSKNEVKLQTTSNDKSNSVNMLVLGKHQ